MRVFTGDANLPTLINSMNPARAAGTEFLTSDEVIEILIDDPLLRRAAVTCVLPATRVGEVWMFRRADLEAWIERQKA